jgi:threonine-phosphate decarboxylase
VRKSTKEINSGTDEARDRLKRTLFSKYGVRGDNVLLAGSLKELIYAVPRALKPKKVLIAGPAVDDYRDSVLSAGLAVETFCCKEEMHFLPDMQALKASAGGSDLAFLANPNRITGRTLDDGVLSEMLVSLSREECTLVIDESFTDFVDEQGCVRNAVQAGNLIVIRTTACYYGMPGLELAYAVSSPEIITALEKESCGVPNLLATVAAQAAIKDKTYRRLSAEFIAEEKRLLYRAVGRMSKVKIYASDTHVMLVRIVDHAADVVRIAEQQGLAVESCSGINCLDSSFLRISVMRHEHNLKLINLLKRVCAEDAGKARQA